MSKRNIRAVLNAALLFTYLLCLFSIGMYEAEKITFTQCMHDFAIYMVFGAINCLTMGILKRA